MHKAFDQDKEKLRWEKQYEAIDPCSYADLKWVFQNYAFFSFDYHCQNYLASKNYNTFIDLGSGPGNWLIYFAKRFGYKVTGMDYSHNAKLLANKNLELAEVDGEIMEGDFLYEKHKEQYDVVYMGGVIEHYEDPKEILLKALDYLKPGGTLVNWIPTSNGISRMYVRLFDSEQLDRVVRIDHSKMELWYRSIELNKIDICYNGSFSLNMFPIHKVKQQRPYLHDLFVFPLGKIINRTVNSSLIFLHKYLHLQIEGKLISPFIVAFGMK